MTNAASVKERLKNLSKKSGKTMQDNLVTYGLERAIYRLSVSKYADRFTLKGGVFLYALFDGEYARATVDLDLLAQQIPNDSEKMKKIFEEVFSIECDDALCFDLSTLEVINITEFKQYHGVNISIVAYLERTQVPISIDIGFGDVIYPRRIQMEFPVLLNMEAPKVYAYSVYSIIAEKFEAFVSLGLANSRYKDFYDIYILANRCDLNGAELKAAIVETFKHRGSTTQKLVGAELDGFILRKRGATWDNLPLPSFKYSDIDEPAVRHFATWAEKKGRLDSSILSEPTEVLMKRLHLVNNGFLTNAAMLMFARDPEEWQLGAYIKLGFLKPIQTFAIKMRFMVHCCNRWTKLLKYCI